MKNFDEKPTTKNLKAGDNPTRTFSGFEKKVKLAPIQQDLYLYNLIHPESNTYNIGGSVNLSTDIERNHWEKAVKWVIQHDDILQSYFLSDHGEPFQVVDPLPSFFFEYVDLMEAPAGMHTAELYLWEQNKRLIDLSSPPLVRNYLIKDRHNEYTAGILMPHILLDGVSAHVFFTRVASVYSSLLKGESIETEEPPSFYDYVENDYPVFDSPETEGFWSTRLQDVTSFDFSPSLGQGNNNVRKKACLNAREIAGIKEYCKTHQHGLLGFLRLPAFFMMVYALLLQRYADCEDDFVVFNILTGRPRDHVNTLGCFYRVLPYIFPKRLFSEQESVTDIFDYVAQYEKGLGKLQYISFPLSNKLLRNPKIKCFYNYRGFANISFMDEKRAMKVYMHHPEDEIHLIVTNLGESIELELFYNESMFPDCHFLERLCLLASHLCQTTGSVDELDILLEKERNHLALYDPIAIPESEPFLAIHEYFEAQASRQPDKVALTCADHVSFPSCNSSEVSRHQGSLTYDELNKKANQLAHHLLDLGIGPDDHVALCLDRSMDLVVAILGIVKAGGAYVPLDPDYPQERLDFMLKDCAAPVLVTREPLTSRFSGNQYKTVCLTSDLDSIRLKSNANPDSRVNKSNLAYVIYTSGSTGKPKGVLVTHGNVVRLFQRTEQWFGFDDKDVWTLFHSCSFDFSVWELWGSLMYGGRLVIIPKILSQSPEAFYNVLHQEQITVLNQTPTSFYSLMYVESSLPVIPPLGLRYVIFGGEALNLAALKPWIERHGDNSPQLINMYGITETTVHVTYRPITRQDVESGHGSLIGGAIPDLRIYLLDKKQRPVPTGLVGEICVGGAGVARGYLNRSELNHEKFIPDPFVGDPEVRKYRSGDLGRMLPDGDIEYLGRMDDQVKVRGFRIEPGEISRTLLKHVAIAQAVVISIKHLPVASGNDSTMAENRLVAYVVTHPGKQITVSELRDFLERRLPDHMVPSAVVFLDRLPLTPNGKLDRQALPLPDTSRPSLEQSYVPPQTRIEKGLAKIFQDILGVEQVGAHDDFFQLGGHSLAAAQLSARARQLFRTDLPIFKIFAMPTVAELASYLEKEAVVEDTSSLYEFEPVSRDVPIPVSFSQERVWFILQLDPENRAYEFLSTLRLVGRLDVQVLEQCLTEIIRRHEIFRTTFREVNGQPCQIIHDPWPVSLPLFDLTDLPPLERNREAELLIDKAAKESFQLDMLPLVRWSLVRLSDNENILIHSEHHIVHDGWSFIVFLRELLELYRAFSKNRPSPLSEPLIQFADFAYWQRQWMRGSEAQKQLAYWKKKLSGCPLQLELPFDRPRPARQSFLGDTLRFDLPGYLANAIESFSRENGSTVYMTMLSAYLTLLYRYTGQEDIVVGTGIANRRWTETENLLGMIINNIALRIDLSGNPSFNDLLARVRETCIEAFENQDVPFDQVVEAVNPARSPSYSPIFQTIFTSYDGPVPALELPGLSVILKEGINNGSAKFDLNVIVISRCKQDPDDCSLEPVDTISLIWEFNTDLFDHVTMRRMVDHYKRILRLMTRRGGQALLEVPFMTDLEQHEQVVELNRTQTAYPRGSTIPELFEEQVEAVPESIALVYGDRQLTYGELNSRANRLAHHLIKLGVGPEVMVGICVERSLEMVVGILGILKAGGAYVPLDPEYPEQRLAFMLNDTSAAVLLTQSHLANNFSDHQARVVCLDIDWPAIASESDENPAAGATADNLAYVIYTSGSTGRPKGTCIEHRSVVRLVKETNYAKFGPDEVFLQFAPISFDASTFELWGSLLNGAKLVVFPVMTPSLGELGEFILKQGITTLWLTAALFHQMVDAHMESLVSVRQILAGGETLSVPHVKKMMENLGEHRLINGYGPTENTTFTACHVMTSESRIGRSVPIGVPISNTQVYILDPHLQPVPMKVYGELYIGGDGLAREYLNQPELTAERFIPNPFSDASSDNIGGSRLYKTGDTVRYLEDGTIEFIGRVDDQVKIRGFRIELGEIEATLAQYPAVDEAVVLCREDIPDDKRLVAYVVMGHESGFTVGDLRSFLVQKLPGYMVPAAFVVLDSLPLTPNGKIDRKALPVPDGDRPDQEAGFTPPQTETEKSIAAIWREVLQLEEIGIHDDFFDLGGHSLLATQVMSRLRGRLNLQLPLSYLFEFPTVATLAQCVEAIRWGSESQKMVSSGTVTELEEGEI